jgi:hypothetical protein
VFDWAWGQFGLVAWAALCLFASGARQKEIPFTGKTLWEIAQATVIVVTLFGLLTEGRGCSSGSTAANSICATGDAGC